MKPRSQTLPMRKKTRRFRFESNAALRSDCGASLHRLGERDRPLLLIWATVFLFLADSPDRRRPERRQPLAEAEPLERRDPALDALVRRLQQFAEPVHRQRRAVGGGSYPFRSCE